MHFGLGTAEEAEVRVTWPDGTVGDWQRTKANGFVTVDRSGGELRTWQPEASP